MNYSVIRNDRVGAELFKEFGRYSLGYDTALFNMTSKISGGVYKGGMWELRRYYNGALLLVMPDSEVVEAKPYNQNYVSCSIEAISIAANIMLLSLRCTEAYGAGDVFYNTLMHDHYHAAKQAIEGYSNFKIENQKVRDFTPEELLIVARENLNSKHPESSKIARIID